MQPYYNNQSLYYHGQATGHQPSNTGYGGTQPKANLGATKLNDPKNMPTPTQDQRQAQKFAEKQELVQTRNKLAQPTQEALKQSRLDQKFPTQGNKLLQSTMPTSSEQLVQNLMSKRPEHLSVGEISHVNNLREEYKNPAIIKNLNELKKKYPFYRSARGDGNCFYRACLFQFLEQIVYSTNFKTKLTTLNTSFSLLDLYSCKSSLKSSVLTNYQLYISQILASGIAELTARLERAKTPADRVKTLQNYLNESEALDFALMVYARSLIWKTYNAVKNHYASFITDSEQTLISKYGEEAQGVILRIAAEAFGCRIKVVQVYKDQNFQTAEYDNEFCSNAFKEIKMEYDFVCLFRPGHYDILYTYDTIQKIYPALFAEVKRDYLAEMQEEKNSSNKKPTLADLNPHQQQIQDQSQTGQSFGMSKIQPKTQDLTQTNYQNKEPETNMPNVRPQSKQTTNLVPNYDPDSGKVQLKQSPKTGDSYPTQNNTVTGSNYQTNQFLNEPQVTLKPKQLIMEFDDSGQVPQNNQVTNTQLGSQLPKQYSNYQQTTINEPSLEQSRPLKIGVQNEKLQSEPKESFTEKDRENLSNLTKQVANIFKTLQNLSDKVNQINDIRIQRCDTCDQILQQFSRFSEVTNQQISILEGNDKQLTGKLEEIQRKQQEQATSSQLQATSSGLQATSSELNKKFSTLIESQQESQNQTKQDSQQIVKKIDDLTQLIQLLKTDKASQLDNQRTNAANPKPEAGQNSPLGRQEQAQPIIQAEKKFQPTNDKKIGISPTQIAEKNNNTVVNKRAEAPANRVQQQPAQNNFYSRPATGNMAGVYNYAYMKK